MELFKKTILITIFFQIFLIGKGYTKYRVGQKFPDFKLPWLKKESGHLSSSKLKGKIVILDFWASWCGPCKKAMPHLEQIYREEKKNGLVIVGINVDESKKEGLQFLKKVQARFPMVFDGQQSLVEKVGVETMPTSFILDRKGVIRKIHLGFRDGDERKIRQEVKSLVKSSAKKKEK